MTTEKINMLRSTSEVIWQILLDLTLSRRRLLSYRNQSTDLLCKSMDWFLHDNGLRHERVKIIVFKFQSHLIAQHQKKKSNHWRHNYDQYDVH